ncbi:hypothetical protein MRX96_016371 [Rhipicephalus microplus]
MAFVPAMYSLASVYMVENPVDMRPVSATVIMAAGIVMISLSWWCQRQRQLVSAGFCQLETPAWCRISTSSFSRVGLSTVRTASRGCARRSTGKYWEEYCSLVKYKMVPYVF